MHVILQHYRYDKHMAMPYTEKAAAKVVRAHSPATMFRGDGGKAPVNLKPAPEPSKIAATAGAQAKPTADVTAAAITVAPGESIQDALDKLKANGGGTLRLAAGLHTLPATLKLPSGITIAGTGIDCELLLDPVKGKGEAAIANADPDMHDVVLRDFVIEGGDAPAASRDPNTDVGQAAAVARADSRRNCVSERWEGHFAQFEIRAHHRAQLYIERGGIIRSGTD